MMLNILKCQINDRVVNDLLKRSTIGIPVYDVLWSITIFTTGFYKQEPFFSFSILIAFLSISFLRILHQRYFKKLAKTHQRLNYDLLVLSILIPAAIWGAVFAISIIGSNSSYIKVVMVMMTAGLCSGGQSAYAPERLLAISYMAILLLPTSLLVFFLNRAEIPTALLILAYFGFMFVLGGRGTKEYWVALENEAKLEEKTRELERISEIDVLTGLYNRRYFNKIFDIEWKLASRENYQLTLIIIDLDHFKKINDTYGHLAGDEFLRELAKVFQSIFKRSTDVIMRYGGEEFAILLPGTNLQDALRLSEALRKTVENLSVTYEGFEIQTTISLGIASCRPDYTDSSEALIIDADEALYKAKENGRNQIQIKTAELL
jgi:diguanylate cyclase (GGDEF)-like protein